MARRCPIPLIPFSGEGGIFFEGAAHIRVPSQSPAVTAPPKGEPSLISTSTRNRRFLPLPTGEVAARSADGEGVCKRAATFATPSQSPAVTAPPKGGAKPHFHLHPQQEVLASPHGRGGNAAGIDGEGVCRGRCPSSPRLIQTNTRIGAFLPLPTGEVAARSADGEGVCKRAATLATPSQSPAVTAPPKGGAKPHFHLHPQQDALASPHGRGGSAQR